TAPFPAGTDYALCKGANSYLDGAPYQGASPSNSTGKGIPTSARGIFDTNSDCRIGDITDGTSNTFLMGEKTGGHARYLARANYTDTTPYIGSNGQAFKLDQSWGVPVIQHAALALGAMQMFDCYYGVTAHTGGFDSTTGGVCVGNAIDSPEPMNNTPAMAAIDWSGTGSPSPSQ